MQENHFFKKNKISNTKDKHAVIGETYIILYN